MMFADEAAVSSNLQSLMNRFANACTVFGLTISLKIGVQAQETTLPNININNYQLEVVDEFTLHT